MLPLVYSALVSSSAVGDIVDDRIYRHGEAPEGVSAPYVTWFVSTATPENLLDQAPVVDDYNVQVDCWSENDGGGDAGVETLAEAVRDALESAGYWWISLAVNGRDQETKRYRIGMIFSLWKTRA